MQNWTHTLNFFKISLASNMSTTIPSSQANVCSFLKSSHPKHGPPVLSALTRPGSVTTTSNNNPSNLKTDTRDKTMIVESKTVHNDNWLERMAINHLSKAVQETSGLETDVPGYKGLVTVCAAMFKEFSLIQQRQLVLNALEKAIPSFYPFLIKKMPPSKFTREVFAFFATIGFRWLVGPSELRELEFEGKKERNVVHITKCRFLEESNCIGMCTNLCKMPTQEFIHKNLGTPVNMVPNFDDMSCEYVFGQEPPAQEDDPAFKQPCYKLCNAKQRHTTSCIS
ncbi:beta-carotene isomerase D27, chloroplastic-like [Rutidosis leptorrhynchoides]|uniref:beta-carotene isomerase D27, chloroplastic-like n=1 Tax=Rutidosis leptorrhynchoides TaxID=125765 RepID=UPI003A99B144